MLFANAVGISYDRYELSVFQDFVDLFTANPSIQDRTILTMIHRLENASACRRLALLRLMEVAAFGVVIAPYSRKISKNKSKCSRGVYANVTSAGLLEIDRLCKDGFLEGSLVDTDDMMC